MGGRSTAARVVTSAQARFDIEALRHLVGEAVFARGSAYHRDGKVEIRAYDERRVLAQVSGTEDYRTEIFGRGDRLRLSCTCPAFEDFGPCKHIVATALAANEPSADGPDAFTRIRAHLERQSVKVLTDLILERAEKDQTLFRKLELAAASGSGGGKQVAMRLRRALDRALKVSDFVAYDEVGGWATAVEDALDAIAGVISAIGPSVAIELAERAIDGIEDAIDQMDDSNGLCSGLLMKARDIHFAATRLARPDPVSLAKNLFRREMDEDYDTFADAARIYGEVLGPAGLAEYRRLANEAWAEIPTRSGKTHTSSSFDSNQFRLFSILDTFAAEVDDDEARIALRRKDLSTAYRYLELAEFCRSRGRRDEALRYAEEGLWLFEDDRPDERLVCLTADLLGALRRRADAASVLYRAFEKAPSFTLYERLRELDGSDVVDRLVAVLEAPPSKKITGWHEARGDLLVRILTCEKRFDAAWATVRRNGASTSIKEALAAASAATHPAEATHVYTARVDELVELGDNRAYESAAAFVARLSDLRDSKEQDAYVADLKSRFRRKRNFMKLLA